MGNKLFYTLQTWSHRRDVTSPALLYHHFHWTCWDERHFLDQLTSTARIRHAMNFVANHPYSLSIPLVWSKFNSRTFFPRSNTLWNKRPRMFNRSIILTCSLGRFPYVNLQFSTSFSRSFTLSSVFFSSVQLSLSGTWIVGKNKQTFLHILPVSGKNYPGFRTDFEWNIFLSQCVFGFCCRMFYSVKILPRLNETEKLVQNLCKI